MLPLSWWPFHQVTLQWVKLELKTVSIFLAIVNLPREKYIGGWTIRKWQQSTKSCFLHICQSTVLPTSQLCPKGEKTKRQTDKGTFAYMCQCMCKQLCLVCVFVCRRMYVFVCGVCACVRLCVFVCARIISRCLGGPDAHPRASSQPSYHIRTPLNPLHCNQCTSLTWCKDKLKTLTKSTH